MEMGIMRKLIKTVSVLLGVLIIRQSFGVIPELKASAADTDGLSVSLGAATNSSGTYYYNNATVTGSGIKTILLSFSESVASGDKINLPTNTPPGFVVSTTSESNDYTKRINIDTGASASDVQSYLREISFTLASTHTSQSVKVTITKESIQYDTFYDVDTQHYYQYVPFTTTTNATWMDAYHAAENMEYMDRSGYLATVTSYDEDVFLNSLSNGSVGWLGGTALTNTGDSANSLYYSGFDTGAVSGNNWYWADGPERGQIFYYGRNTDRSSNSDGTDPYWNWGSSTEPNGNTTVTGENCLSTLNRLSIDNQRGYHGTDFSWNDIIWNTENEGNFSAKGFFVEYGNQALGSSEAVDATKYASDSGSLNETYTVSISGSPVAGHTLTANLTGGSGTLSYQWTRDDGAVSSATGQTYTLTAADVGHQIAVKITLNGTTVNSPTVTVTTLTLDTILSAMPDITEDISTDANNGELVSDLLSGHTSGADGDTLGIAVTATDNANGQWQYMMPGGQWWTIPKSGTLSETTALLIPSGAKIRFCPAINYNGAATITYRAWDEALGGNSEGSADVSVNGAGTAYSAEESGAKINVTAVNDAPDVIKNGGGKALQFTGVESQAMTVPDMHLNSSFTVGCWVNADSYNTWERIFDFGNGEGKDNQILGFYDNDNYASKNMYLEFYENGTSAAQLITPNVFPLNQWVYVTAVYDSVSQTGYIYWNGVLQVSGFIPRQAVPSVTRSCSYFGKSNWAQDAYFKGEMYNISVWNVAKSQDQIRSDMNTTPTGNETGLVAAYNLTEGSGTTAADCSSAHNNAALSGINWVDNSAFDYSVSGYENSDIAVSNLCMTDVDAGSGTVQIELSASKGKLTFGSTTDLTFVSCSNGQSTLTVQGKMQDINSALSTLTYHPNTDYTGTDSITVQADDLGLTGDGGTQMSDVKTVNVTMQPVTVPDAPTITSVTSGGSYDKAAVTFTLPLNDGGGGITDYTITATPEGGGTAVTANGDGSPITVPNLQPGITYDFTVSATNSAGAGPVSSPIQYTTPGRPTAPTVNATVSGNSYSGNWTSGSVTMVASGSTAVADTIDHYEYKIGDSGTWTPLDVDNVLTINSNMNDTVYFRAVSGSDLSSAESTPCAVKIDRAAPTGVTVKITTNPVKQILNVISFGLFFRDTVDVTLSATDNTSGVNQDAYEYQLVNDGDPYKENGTWTTCGSTFSINSQFKGTIYARAVDNAGNISAATQSDKFVIDKNTPTAPVIAETVNGNVYDGSSWTYGDIKFVASGSTALSGIDHYEYSTDNGGTWNPMPAESGITDSISGQTIEDSWTIASDRNGTVLVRAVSNSGVEGSESSVTVKRDAVTPAVNVAVTGTTGQWTGSPVSFTLSDTANNISPVTYWVKIGSSEWTQLSEGTFSLNTDTNTTYQFKAVSASGIESSFSTVYTVQLDMDNPTITSMNGNPINWTNSNVTLTVDANDNGGSGVKEYSFDGGHTWQTSNANTYTVNQTIPANTIMVRDNVGNETSYNTEINITKIDKTAPVSPTITITSNPVKQILHAISFGLFFNDTVEVSLSSTDNLSNIKKYEYQLVSENSILADDAWTTCGGTFSIDPQFKGTIYARAVDNAGNISTASQSDKFVTDKQIPTAPVIEETVNGNAYDGSSWTSGNIKLAASGSTALSGTDYYEYSTDNGGSWAKMEDQSLTTDNTSGQYINDTQTINTNMNCTVLVRAISNSEIKGETASVPVKRDAAVPSFTVDVTGTVGQWTASPVSFTLTGTGGNISPVTYYIKIGSSDWTVLSGNSVPFSDSMNEICQFKAVSATGNEATSEEYSVMIDAGLPTLSVSGNPVNWTNQDVTLHVDAECTPYGVQSVTVSKDGGEAMNITGQNNYVASENGSYAFTATGRAGNHVSTTVNVTKIDKTMPNGMTVKVSPNAFTGFLHAITFGLFFNSTTDITLSADDALSGINYYEYQLVDTSKGQSYNANGTWVQSASGTFSIDPQFKGVIYARAVDKAGNVTASSEIVQTDGFAVDNQKPTAPTATATVNGDAYNSGWTSCDVKIVASGAMALSGIQYYEFKIGDSGTWTKMPDQSGATDGTSGNAVADTLTIDADMNEDIHIRAMSNSGIESNDSVVTVKRDSVVPSINAAVSGTTGQWTEDPVTFTLSNTENNISPVIYWVKIGSGDWTQLSGDTYKVTGDVNTNYQFEAVSGSGLTSSASDTYTVKLASNTLDDVINKIDNLPDPGSASDKDITDKAQAIKDAKILYDTLSTDEQSGVGQSRIDKLNRLIGRLNALLVIIPKDSSTGITAGNIGTSVQVPELNDPNISKVVVKLVVDPVSGPTLPANVSTATLALDNFDKSIVAAYDVSLLKTVYDTSGTQLSSGKVSNSEIDGPVMIRIPVPSEYIGQTGLQVVYINNAGAITPMPTTLITVDGIEYLQFTTTHFSLYSITVPNKASTIPNPKTGEANDNLLWYIWSLASGLILTEGLIIRRRKKDLARQK